MWDVMSTLILISTVSTDFELASSTFLITYFIAMVFGGRVE